MAGVSLFCLALYTLTSLVVGTRLILRARTSRGLPELLVGLCYFAAAGVGYPLSVISPALENRAGMLVVGASGEILIALGCSCFWFFNARVFQPNARWSMPLAVLGSLALAAGATIVISSYVSIPDRALAEAQSRGGSAATLFSIGAAYAWTGIEGLRHYRMMRKRLALGLAEPIVTNRFLLWGLSGLVSVAWNSVATVYLLAGANVSVDPVPMLAISVGGLLNAIMLVLIFLAPAWYTRWVGRERSTRALATA